MALYLVSEYLIPPQGTREQRPAGVKGLVSPASLPVAAPTEISWQGHRQVLDQSQASKVGPSLPLILHRTLRFKELCSQVSQMALTVGRLSIP